MNPRPPWRRLLDRVADILSPWISRWGAQGGLRSVALRAHIEREAGEPDLLISELVVDGEVLTAFDHGPIDLAELIGSLKDDGDFFIWTCTCGEPGCSGRFRGVRARHRADRIRWRCLDTGRRFQFSTVALTQAVETMTQESRRLLATQPSLIVAPEQNTPFLHPGAVVDSSP